MVKQFVIVETEHGYTVAVHGPFKCRDDASEWAAYNIKRPCGFAIRSLDRPE